MKVNPAEYKNIHEYSVPAQQNIKYSEPAFEGAKSRKFLKMIEQTKNFKKVKATFQDMVDAYKELGYDITLKRGSHAAVNIQNKFNISLVIPHKDKYVTPYDLKRLHLIIIGKFEEARFLH